MGPHALKKRKLASDIKPQVTSDERLPHLDPDSASQESGADDAGKAELDQAANTRPPSTRPKRTVDHGRVPASLGAGHGSSVFSLQVEELLAEVRPNYEKRMSSVDAALRRLKKIIERIPAREEHSVCLQPTLAVQRSPDMY